MTRSPQQTSFPLPRVMLFTGVFSLIYFILLGCYLSSHNILWLDEFFAWNLLSDPSLFHAISGWNHGADSGGILYYIVGWLLMKLTGPHVLTMRLFSAVSLWLASLLYWRLLARSFSPLTAFCGVSLLWCTHEFVIRVAEVRFYGFYILMTVVATYATLSTISRPMRPLKIFLICLCAHAALIGSHLMGAVYSGAILIAILAGKRSKNTLAAAAGIVCAWPMLLFFRSAIYYGAGNQASLDMPRLADLLIYYHLSLNLKVDGLLFLVLLVCLLVILRKASLHRSSWLLSDDPQPLLLRVSLCFFLSPVAFYLASHLAQPMFARRYMYPFLLGTATFSTLILWIASKKTQFRNHPALLHSGLLLLAALILALHVREVLHQPSRPMIDTQTLAQAADGLPLVSPDEEAFFQLNFYPTQPGLHVYFLSNLESDLLHHPKMPLGMMGTIQHQGYWAGRMEDVTRFADEHNSFLYLDFPLKRPFRQAYLSDADWHMQPVGTIQVRSAPISILRFDRIQR
jgi:hypothetical protein